VTEGLARAPEGVTFNALSARVFETLARYTAFPWPILMTQAKRCGANPAALDPQVFDELVPHLAAGVARYTTPDKGVAVQRELLALVGKPASGE
jgi:hypothetical protein